MKDRLIKALKTAFPKGIKTSWWLIRITIPVSFAVLLLDYYGILNWIANYTEPVFKLIGLPGVSAVVFITSIFTNVYSVVAILTTLNFPVREGMILATMCLVSHNFPIETAVLRKTGSSALRMILLRIIGSFFVGWLLNLLLPAHSGSGFSSEANTQIEFLPVFYSWIKGTLSTVLKILVLVNLLIILQQILEDFGFIKWLEKPLSPLMKLFGLPQNTAFPWLIANLIGLAYGSATMLSQSEEGKMGKDEADLLNHHIALSHSQLEDPLLFLTLGYTIYWLIWPRVIIALAAVWLRKAELKWMPACRKARSKWLEKNRTMNQS
jgi:hypothetical protein